LVILRTWQERWSSFAPKRLVTSPEWYFRLTAAIYSDGIARINVRAHSPPMQILKRFANLVDGLNDKIGYGIKWLTLVMVLVGAGTAVLRYFGRGLGLSLNLTPPTELQWYLFSLIFLLGAAYGLNQNVHVRVDVLYEKLSAKKQAWIDLVGTVIFLLPFSLVMLYVSWPAVRSSVQLMETSPDPGGLPRWPIKIVILLAFGLLALQGLSQIVKQVEIIRGVAPEPDENPEVHA
jgi:TRAP-type mannitol/chloroaromatic compound transport system permease small subunit